MAAFVVAAWCVSVCCGYAGPSAPGGRFLIFSGTDLWSKGGFLHGGILWSPDGLDAPGFTLKTLISGGSYRYASGALGTKVRGRELVALVMPGWRFKSGRTDLTVYAGLDLENHHLKPDDPDSALRGDDTGLRVGVDYWTEPAPNTMAQINATLSTIENSYSAHAAWGWRVFDGFYAGPEIQYFSSGDYGQARIGLQIAVLRFTGCEWSAAAGWAHDSDSQTGAYVRLGVLLRR